jgi:hypothetical protein
MVPASPEAIRALDVSPRAKASSYPDADRQAILGSDGRWVFARKDGTAD